VNEEDKSLARITQTTMHNPFRIKRTIRMYVFIILQQRDGRLASYIRSNAVTTVSKLIICSCWLWSGSKHMLHDFMHNPTEPTKKMVLRELAIESIATACDQSSAMWATLPRPILAAQPPVRPPIRPCYDCFFTSPGFRSSVYRQGRDLHPPAPLVHARQCGLTIRSSIPGISASLDPSRGHCFPRFLAELIARLQTLIFHHADIDAAQPVL
jgi:hypothetical protein